VFEKFSASAIQAINAAREETLRLEFNQVDTDHLLLGLAHERASVVARTLEKQQIGVRQLRLAVEHLSGRGYSLTRMEDLIFAPATLRTLARAALANPTLVESQDLFFALLEERESAALAVLKHLKLDVEAVGRVGRELAHADAPVPDAAVLPQHFSHRLLTTLGDSVLSYAYAAARYFGHTIVGTEQLLTGLLYVRDGLAAQVLAANGVEAMEVEAITARVIGRGSGAIAGRVTLSRWTEEVLEHAWAAARKLKHTQVGTGHILLGLTELDVGGALYIMDHLDVNLAQIRYDIEQAFLTAPGDPEPAEAYPAPEDAEAALEEV
jgi:ATP-dependent Clp protease ATP-binding subunit ClpA